MYRESRPALNDDDHAPSGEHMTEIRYRPFPNRKLVRQIIDLDAFEHSPGIEFCVECLRQRGVLRRHIKRSRRTTTRFRPVVAK